MSKIKVMSEQLSNRIAAGEVIERPASVVKELVENAIDAGARRVRIEIERAGSRLIAVSDDGCGMDGDDAMLSLEPHGTSKLLSEDDIDNIVTLGFRGEALPSIASISRLTLTTRTAGQLEGTQIVVEGGKLIDAGPCGGAVGTTIRVRDLFFNTPARKKFLKADATEAHHIEEAVLALAIPRPEVAFELVMDGRSVFHSPAAENAAPRLREFFGRVYADSLWPVSHRENGMEITGYIASPGFTRNSRREQRTFVNGRAVESLAIYRGIRDGYATLAESGRFPPAILFLVMSPLDVDVNVHPAKREVRFKHEYAVSRAIAAAVGNALKRTREAGPPAGAEGLPLSGQIPLRMVLDSAAVQYEPRRSEQPVMPEIIPPAPGQPSAEEYETTPPPQAATPPAGLSPADSAVSSESRPEPAENDLYVSPPVPNENAGFLTDTAPGTEPEAAAALAVRSKFDYPDIPFNGEWPTGIIGVLDDTYLLASGKTGLILIDQHAAHERVLYEKTLKSMKTREFTSQMISPPIVLNLSMQEAELLNTYMDQFTRIGFEIEEFGQDSYAVRAVPDNLFSIAKKELLIQMLDSLSDEITRNQSPDLIDEKIASMSCKAAVKGNMKLSVQEVDALIGELLSLDNPYHCPHGRPTIIAMTKRELEKKFKRIV